MSKARGAAIAPSTVLPVPAPVVKHHETTLQAPMREWAAQKRVPPVLLLTGTTGVGKRAMAYYLAQWILCERSGFRASQSEDEGPGLFGGDLLGAPAPVESAAPAEPRPCGECNACQKALHATWVDFTEIVPEADEETLKIDQFRRLKSSMGFGAHEGSHRITLIPDADRMTPQAANSMLKLLEEPPRQWVFLLTASDPALLLPTIVSRCQQFRLRPFSTSELSEILEPQIADSQRREICARLAQGSWSRALALSGDECWKDRKLIFDFIADPAPHLGALVDWTTQEPARFGFLVDQLEHAVSDLLGWSLGAPEFMNADGRAALAFHAKDALRAFGSKEGARRFWMERADRLARSRAEALAPLNRKVLVQDLLMPWMLPGTPSR